MEPGSRTARRTSSTRPACRRHHNPQARRIRNYIHHVNLELIASLEPFEAVALEKTKVNRLLKGTYGSWFRQRQSAQLGYLLTQLGHKLDWLGIPCVRVNPAYTSQRCIKCGYVDESNRPNQSTFICQVCGYTAHADTNGAQNCQERFYDAELNAASVKATRELLYKRYQLSQVDRRSTSRLDNPFGEAISLVKAHSIP